MKTIVQLVSGLKDYLIEKDTAAKQAVESNIASVETDASSASKAYAVGQQLVLNDILYDVIDSIAIEDSLVVGTNIQVADKVSVAIAELALQNETLTNNVSDINTALGNEVATRAKLGGHNILPNTGAATATNYDITFTKQSDGSVVASGTASGWAAYRISDFTLEAGTYVLSGRPDQNSTAIQLKLSNRADWSDVYVLTSGTEHEFTISAKTDIRAFIYVGADAGAVNLTFKPMIRLATDASSDYEPYSMTNREMTPYVQAISNPNLLDNSWFTVNQRGVTSWTNYCYTVDRWNIDAGNASISNGVLSHTGNLYQVLEDERIEPLLGKVVTASILKSDDSIESVTFTMPSSLTGEYVTYGASTSFCLLLRNGNASQIMRIYGNVAVKAVKLELGSVSTLAMDTAPNYATELLKCQRYFYKTLQFDDNGMNISPNQCLAVSATRLQGIKFPVQMRTNPTVTVINVTKMDDPTVISGVIAQWNTKEGVSYFGISNATVGELYCVDFEASAEL